jgi:hypothetical protein
MNFIKSWIFMMLIGGLLAGISSCTNTPSMQRFIAENETKQGFTSITIPGNTLAEDTSIVTKNSMEFGSAINTVQILIYNSENDSTESDGMTAYVEQLNRIVKNPDRYEVLFQMMKDGQNMALYAHTSENSEISELIGLMIDDEQFIMGRLTGNLSAESMTSFAQSVDFERLAESKAFKDMMNATN